MPTTAFFFKNNWSLLFFSNVAIRLVIIGVITIKFLLYCQQNQF
jgi:hypothetical protein